MVEALVEHRERRFPPAGAVVAGRYVVERLLGVGGMGAVVAAQDLRAGRLVAIKFLLPRCAEEALLVVRFEREARGTDRLRSEHVRRVLGAGVAGGNTPYLVMEYLDGEDLRALVRREGPLAVERAARYVSQAGRALAEAHALGIVHRDLKPANLFLARQHGGEAIVKVVDFGVAKFHSPNVAGDTSDVSHAAQVLGSRHFMAPEQLLSPHSVDALADVWALGAILYYLLTGKGPFAAPTAEEVTLNMLSAPPHPILALRPELPPDLVDVISRCLERDRARRPPNVVEVIRALAPFADATTEDGRQLATRSYLARTQDLGKVVLPEPPKAAPAPASRRGPRRPEPKRRAPPRALQIALAVMTGGALALAVVAPRLRAAPAQPALELTAPAAIGAIAAPQAPQRTAAAEPPMPEPASSSTPAPAAMPAPPRAKTSATRSQPKEAPLPVAPPARPSPSATAAAAPTAAAPTATPAPTASHRMFGLEE